MSDLIARLASLRDDLVLGTIEQFKRAPDGTAIEDLAPILVDWWIEAAARSTGPNSPDAATPALALGAAILKARNAEGRQDQE
jgi:hypothetical protein